MLVVEGLTKRYGKTLALDGFSLEVRAGEVTGLIGHNGAGKTTFVEVTTGLVRPGAGRVTVCGIDALAEPRAARALFGVAPQELALYPTVTVREHLGLFAGLAGLRRAAAARSVEAVAEELVLGDVLDRRCAVLSGGQRRRTQAAAAMVGSPRVLLLDEPTAGADPETRQALLAAVRARADAGAAVVYTTHYLPELVDLDATLAVARAGRVVARGERAALTSGLPGEVRVALDPDRPRPGLPAELGSRTRDDGQGGLRIATFDPPADLAALLTAGCAPLAVDVRRPDLDDLYAALATSAPKALATPPGTEAEFASGGFVDGGRQPEPGAGVLAAGPPGPGAGGRKPGPDAVDARMSVANVPGAADAADAAGAGGEPGCSGIRSPRAEAGRNGGVRVSDGAGSPISAAAATQRRPAVTGVDRHAAVFLPPGGEEGIRPGADAGADSAVRVSAAASGVTSAGEPRQPRDPREGGGGARGGVGRAGVLVRHNAAVLLHEPGPLIGRLLMPVILLLAMRPLYTAVQGPSGTALAVVGSLVTFSLLALSIVGSSILSERVWRTWDRLRQTPVRAGELLIGKALPVFGVLAAQQVFVLGFGVVAFGMRVAAPGLLVAACVAWILALLGMGSAAALLVRSYGQLMAAFDIGAFFLTTLGGVLVPLSTLPGWMRAAAPLSPGYWAADALREAAMGHAPRTYTDICVLLAIAAVTGTIAVRRVTRGWGRALAV